VFQIPCGVYVLLCVLAASASVMSPNQRLVSSSTGLITQPNHPVRNKDQNTSTHVTADGEAKRYTLTQQMAAVTIEPSGKDVGNSKEGMERLAVSSGAVVLLTSGAGSSQYSLQVLLFCSLVFVLLSYAVNFTMKELRQDLRA
jgi:hypothetical protein